MHLFCCCFCQSVGEGLDKQVFIRSCSYNPSMSASMEEAKAPMVSGMPEEIGRIKSLRQRKGLPSLFGVCWRSKGRVMNRSFSFSIIRLSRQSLPCKAWRWSLLHNPGQADRASGWPLLNSCIASEALLRSSSGKVVSHEARQASHPWMLAMAAKRGWNPHAWKSKSSWCREWLYVFYKIKWYS